MFYSIIVPCYNCNETIAPLLKSIIDQDNLDLEQVEVILVDDTEDHEFLEHIPEEYYEKLDISSVSTDLHNHNPGNSRNYGLDAAVGDWIVFIDCDDTFRPNAFGCFSRSIVTHPNSPCHMGMLKQFHPDGTEFTEDEDYQSRHIVWLHGKCYNHKFLLDNNIRFIPEMKSCEDYWFNYQVMAHTLNTNTSIAQINEFVYNWLYNDKSLSRSTSYFLDLKEHFYDHIRASLLSWVQIKPLNPQPVFEWYINLIVVNYFLYQYYISKGIYFKKDIVRESISKALEVFGITILDIINAVEAHPEDFRKFNAQALGFTEEDFVCPYSFRTWVLNLYN